MAQFHLTSGGYTPVPDYFIEHCMPQANGIFVKVYLYALSLAAKGREASYGQIADKLCILESDVVQAFAFWEKQGLLKQDRQTVTLIERVQDGAIVQSENKPVVNEPVKQVKPPASSVHQNYDSADIAREIEKNQALSQMCMVAQGLLGKTLSANDMKMLYSFYDWLGFPPEVILMLLEYCVGLGKRNMKYIEKVAISWSEAGVNTIEAAQKYIVNQKKKKDIFYQVRKELGILDRALTQAEERYITTWHDEYHMAPEMICKAYECCVLQINKLSMPYMDKILARWNREGIHTTADADRDSSTFHTGKGAQQIQTAASSGSYDYDALERQMWEKLEGGK
jgi:DnaD/phage-associated family protein